MTKEELIEFLRDNLRIEIDYHKARVYYDNSKITAKLLLGEEEICVYTEYLRD